MRVRDNKTAILIVNDRNFAQSADPNDGMMIDMVNLKDFQMNNDTWHASVGSGYRLDDLDKLLHQNGGRAMAHGTCPGVGVGGHATVVSINFCVPVSRSTQVLIRDA